VVTREIKHGNKFKIIHFACNQGLSFSSLELLALLTTNDSVSRVQNGDSTNPYCQGIDGVLQAYYQTLRTVQLYGPTNFSPVINHVARYTSHRCRINNSLRSVTPSTVNPLKCSGIRFEVFSSIHVKPNLISDIRALWR